jgi:uncharacterized membrane protein YjgN (DUF898 family)
METINDTLAGDSNVEIPHLTSESIAYLLKAAKWGKFLAILGFILAALMIVAAIAMSLVLNFVQDELVPLNMPFSTKLISIFYIIFAGVYLIPVLFLNSFSNNALKAINLSSTEKLTASLKNLKNLFVFVGVSTIVILALYTLTLIIVGTAALIGF